MRARLAEEWAILLVAARFLTRLPLPGGHWTPARMAATPRWYPAVGILVGAIAALVYWVAAQLFSPALAALLSTAAGMLATGCLHEDGFADVCDGLGGAGRERALEIMRDSRIGTYGAAGLGLMLGAKILALAALPVPIVPWVLIAGHVSSRASSVVVIATSDYVRDTGAGKPIAGGVGRGGLAVALGTTGVVILGLGFVLPWGPILGGIGGLVLGHGLMRAGFERRLGGYTGDCLGAAQQASEIGFYLGLLACL